MSGSTSTNAIRFTGRENDDDGLFFYRMRFYGAQTQRFISEDPVGLFGGSNFYRYVEDSPTNRIDPLGLASCCKQDRLTCLAKCIQHFDPLGPSGDLVLSLAGGTLVKSWFNIPQYFGSGPLFTIPSAIELGTGLTLRSVGRFFSPAWIAYGDHLFLAELYCLEECSRDKCKFQ